MVIVYFVSACSKEAGRNITDEAPYYDPIVGLASPIQLTGDTTVVNLQDYFLDVDVIDSIHPSNCLDWRKGSSTLKLLPSYLIQCGSSHVITAYVDGEGYTIVTKKSLRQTVEISFDPKSIRYKKVQLSGDFNGWNPNKTELTLANDTWTAELDLNPGKYQYQIVVDGEWKLDPNNEVIESNGIGGFNSVLNVGNNENSQKISWTQTNIQYLVLNSDAKNWNHLILWENEFTSFFESKKNRQNWVGIIIPEKAKKIKRSYLRMFAFDSNDVATNDLIVPLEYGEPITSTSQLTRKDKHFNSLYFALVDRFNNGDKSNDQPVDDERVHFKANYQGGDLAGIEQKIKENYFSDLGFNSVWLSPITQNPLEAYQEYPEPKRFYSGYHGYWPISYKRVDHRFGTNAEFKNLVEKAHENNQNVILDFVSNHVHEKHPMYQAHKDWSTTLDLPDGTKNIRIWDAERLTTWFDTFLPTLDFSREEIIDAVSDSAMYWLDEYGVDGYRHDAAKHIPESFWRAFTKKVKAKYGSDIYQIGETFGSRELIGNYVNSGQQDAQFDFNLYFDARSVLIDEKESFERLNNSLHESFDYYGWHSLMGNITGNHDMPRFISYASKAISFNEDVQKAGWERDVQIIDTVGYDKLSLLHAFVATIPGVPIVYYGDEIGILGAGDPDNRRMMNFDSLNRYQTRTKKTLTKLMSIRNSNMALIYGDFKTINTDNSTWVYTRKYFKNEVVVLMNKSSETQTIELENLKRFEQNFGSTINGNSIILKPYSFEVLVKK